MQNIGLAIYNWRTKNGMSQQQAASWLGVSYQTVANIETGRTNPSKKTLRKLCNVVGDLGEQAVEEAPETPENGSYVPFTERLAAMYPEKQQQFDEEAKAKAAANAPSDADRSDIARIIGYFEGVAAATDVKMCDNINHLEQILTKYALL